MAAVHRLGGWVTRHRLAVIIAWIAALVAVGAIVAQVGAVTTNDLQLPGTDSQRATGLLATRFPPQQYGKSPIVFYVQPITQAIFPVSHLASALLVAYNPNTTGAGFAWRDLAVLVLWGVGGLIVARRRFTWMPRGR